VSGVLCTMMISDCRMYVGKEEGQREREREIDESRTHLQMIQIEKDDVSLRSTDCFVIPALSEEPLPAQN